MKIYKFDKHGKLVNTFNTIIECANHFKVNRSYIYRAIEDGLKIHNNFTLSFSTNERLAAKSKVKCNPDINDHILMANYRDNLIKSLGEKLKDRNTSVIDRDRIIFELVDLNNFLTK